MKQPADLARSLLEMATRDQRLFQFIVGESEIDDEMVGFHAQQMVEKCIKAVLTLHNVEFRRTHDIRELLDLLSDGDIALPPNADELTDLTRFAVVLRYDFLGSEPLDRALASLQVEHTYAWAKNQLAGND